MVEVLAGVSSSAGEHVSVKIRSVNIRKAQQDSKATTIVPVHPEDASSKECMLRFHCKSAVPADTDHISMGVQSRPPPALMSLLITKESAHHKKLPQIQLGAMFAQLMSDWTHCEDQQKEIILCLFPEH